MVYTSDTFLIHVVNEKISSRDSLAQLDDILKQLGVSDYNIKEINKRGNPENPTMIKFFNTDSIYTANAAEPFQITYSIGFFNVPNFSPDKAGKIYVDKLNYPEDITIVSAVWGKTDSTKLLTPDLKMRKGWAYIAHYNIKLIAKQVRTYTLPALGFTYADEKHIAPAINVIVK